MFCFLTWLQLEDILLVSMRVKLVLLFTLMFFFASVEVAGAQTLLKVDPKGGVTLNVLSASDSLSLNIPKSEPIEIKKITDIFADTTSKIKLTQVDGKYSLTLTNPTETKELNVTGWKEDLVEIEKRGDVESVKIFIKDGKFSIEQKGVKVVTDYSISVNPETAEITVSAPSGERKIAVLPSEALMALLRAKIVTTLSPNANLVEESGKDLTYNAVGTKVVNLFNVYDLPIEINAKVSASTGEIVFTDEPVWVKVLGVFLTK